MMTVLSLILACLTVSILVLVYRTALLDRKLDLLKLEVRKCLRILYAAVEADPEGGD